MSALVYFCIKFKAIGSIQSKLSLSILFFTFTYESSVFFNYLYAFVNNSSLLDFTNLSIESEE